MQTLDVGEPAKITTSWYNDEGVDTEPTSITLTLYPPSGSPLAFTKNDFVQGDDVWVWIFTRTVNEEGIWRYDVSGSVGGATVKLPSGVFLVGSEQSDGPCEPWTSWEEIEACASTLSAATTQQRELAVDQASELLYLLSGRVYSGICVRTRSLCYACRTCYLPVCGCAPLNGLDLGGGVEPVWGVWDITIDGAVLPADAAHVVGRRWVVRDDGGTWPSGLNVEDEEAFRATIAAGRRIPSAARTAARLFAVEIAKGCVGDSTCAIPKRVTNINRGGVTYTILDSMSMIAEGRTGVPLVDLWLVADRKGRRPRPRGFQPGAVQGIRRFA